MQTEFAPAKLNLYLHVTGRRPDGYHLLESLVAFADVGDTLSFEPDADLELRIEGAQAGAFANENPEDNLVMLAMRGFTACFGGDPRYRVHLDKVLPIAAGLGGGSADAAAALRFLARRARIALDHPDLQSLALSLGADVPMCLDPWPCYVSGVGEQLTPAPALPAPGLLLVNPGVSVPTPAVFDAFKSAQTAFNPPVPPLRVVDFATSMYLAEALAQRTNALTQAAVSVAPAIADVLDKLQATPECLLARMLGSGATCYGLYPSRAEATVAAAILRSHYPDWSLGAWIMPASFYRDQNQSEKPYHFG